MGTADLRLLDGDEVGSRRNVVQARLTGFSDIMRTIAMAGVVLIHCGLPYAPGTADYAVIQVGKFCETAFFMVSGYLWMRARGADHPGQYVSRRLRSLIPPYAFWVALMASFTVVRLILSPRHVLNLPDVLEHVFVLSPFWFIPNLLFALVATSVLWKACGEWASGLMCWALIFLYGLNVVQGWMDIPQTMAPMGFGAFVWLGFWVHEHEQLVRGTLLRLRLSWLVIAVSMTYGIAAWESASLRDADSLRLGNTAFGLAVVALVSALGYRRNWSWRERPVGTNYGIYLSHGLIAAMLVGIISLFSSDELRNGGPVSPLISVPGRLAIFLVVYASARLVVACGTRMGLGRLVGAPPAKGPRARTPTDTRESALDN